MQTDEHAVANSLDFLSAREPASDAAHRVIAHAEAKKADRAGVVGIKGLQLGKSDTYEVSPFDIQVKPGWNTRDFSTPENQQHVTDLATSIAVRGVEQPMIVYTESGILYLSDGESRLRATLYAINVLGAEILSVPVRMEPRGSNDADRIAGQLVRNSGKPLSTMEKAEVVRRLLAHKWDVHKIASHVGLSAGRVNQLMELLELPEEMRQHIAHGTVAASEAVKAVREHGDAAPALVERAAALSSANGGKRAGKATRATLKAAVGPAEGTEENDSDAPDVGAELESAHAEIDRLTALVESLSTNDSAREIISLQAKFAQLNGRLQQQITTGSEARKQAEHYGGLLKKVRTVLGVSANSEILSAIETLKP